VVVVDADAPLPSVIVTVYTTTDGVPDAVGVAVTEVPVVAESPVAGDQV
jgi:hypothetical protein